MRSVKKMFNRKKIMLAAGVVVLYTVAVVSIWIVSQRNAKHKTEELLEYASKDLGVTIGIMVDGQLAATAETVIDDMGGELKNLSVEECRKLTKVHGIDEVCLMDGKGVIVASSEPTTIGFDMSSAEETREFMACTNKTVPYVSQDFRGSRAIKRDILRKYLAVPFPKGEGFIQVGYDASRLASLFAKRYNELMKTWQFGEAGCFVCADARTGELLFDVYDGNDGAREVRGKFLQDYGLDPQGLPDDKTVTFRATLFGVPCFCRNFTYLGFRILPTVPENEFYSMGLKITLSAAAILLIVFGIFCYTIGKIETANKAIALMRKTEDERREKDMRMAKSIQSNVLPTMFPPYPDMADRVDIFAGMRTAKEVGGDFYDFYFAGRGKLAIVIADVSGKGVPAAMFMMRAKTTLQALLKGGGDIAEIVAETNNRLCQGNEANMFVTAWVGVVDLANGKVEYVNAGHNPPVVRHVDGSFTYLRDKHGPPLAAMDGIPYKKGFIDLSLGEGIFLYTDGVTESTNPALELYGEDRLLAAFQSATEVRSSKQLCNDLLADVDRFASGAEQADDITMLAFKLNGIQRTFDASQEGLLEAQSLLEEFGDNPKAAVIQDEIISNIVRCSGAHTFTVKLIRNGNDLTMVFIDAGKAFDPLTEAPVPDVTASADKRGIGGLGIYMVKKMSKATSYARIKDQNVLTITVAM